MDAVQVRQGYSSASVNILEKYKHLGYLYTAITNPGLSATRLFCFPV
jgi:hypothetical protein